MFGYFVGRRDFESSSSGNDLMFRPIVIKIIEPAPERRDFAFNLGSSMLALWTDTKKWKWQGRENSPSSGARWPY